MAGSDRICQSEPVKLSPKWRPRAAWNQQAVSHRPPRRPGFRNSCIPQGLAALIPDSKRSILEHRTEEGKYFAEEGKEPSVSVGRDRKSTRLNSSHSSISYAV